VNIAELSNVKELHHAYLVTGSAEHGQKEVVALLEKRGVKTVGNPDVLSYSFSELLVDEVRDRLLPFAALKPLGERKYLIISYSRANDASQNALLKAVEESLGNTTFFFCVDSAGHMLPTLRSRCVEVSLGELAVDPEKNTDAQQFLKASFEKRLAVVEKMTTYISKTQDRAPARGFIRSLLEITHGKASSSALRDLLSADRYMRMQGSSPKSVLSHLAVTLPRL
jgi:DNA polymerase III delta prime subunit